MKHSRENYLTLKIWNDPFMPFWGLQIHKLSNKGKTVKTFHGGQNKYKRILELRDAQRSRICPTHVSKFCNALFQFKWRLGDQMNNFTNFYHFLLSSVKVKVSQVSQLGNKTKANLRKVNQSKADQLHKPI